MTRSLLVWLGFGVTAFGIVANYDDLKFQRGPPYFTIPLGGSNTKPETPFTYKGLTYINWYQATVDNSTVRGIIPSSKPNIIGSSQYDPIIQGQDARHPPKRISIADPKQSFDLLGFFYGCATLDGLPYAPICAITVTGTYANGKGQVPSATFGFFPIDSITSTGMFKAQLPDWFKGLKEVTVGIGGADSPNFVHVIDDLTYNIHGGGGSY